MAPTPDAVAREWFEHVWNQGSEEAIDRLAARDTIIHGLQSPDGKPITALAGFKPFFNMFRQAFPDIRVAVEQTVTEGNTVVAYCRVTGTHHGPNLGVAATGRPFEITGMTMLRVVDGRIVEGWNSYDFLGLYQQLGLLATGV